MAAFVYRVGDVVPRDVTHVIVHPSVRVLPPGAFYWCEKLEEVQLHEGLEEIGDSAFGGCYSLIRLGCPSTVVRIASSAFACCATLEEIRLNEGLKEIGDGAFVGCVSLRRLYCPSTVVRIGDGAFVGCKKLEEVQLHEGLEEIGSGAFRQCVSLRRLNCPSTVVRIGRSAFWCCCKLSMVELTGIVKVEDGAFSPCESMERIRIPSRAFVFQRGNTRLVTDGTIAPTRDAFVLFAPGCLTTMPESILTELRNSIGTIMSNIEENVDEETLDIRLGQVHQVVCKEVRGEVSAILGLAFWRAKIDQAKRARTSAANYHGGKSTGGGQERTKGDEVLTRKAREGCRGAGKGKEIAQNVLPFFDGLW